jgi:branched-chain amino acid transport system permease protein
VEQFSLRRLAILLLIGLAAAALPWIVPEANLRGITRIVMLSGAVMSLNLLIGNAGLVSMGHGLFLGVGAYVVAILNIKHGVGVGWAALCAIGVSLIVAIVAGIVALRARLLFFALLTLALGQVAFVFVARNYSLTGGDDGLVGITLPHWLDTDVAQHLLAVGVTTAVCLVLMALLASPFGTTLRAVRDNSDRVASLGGNPKRYEFAAFVIAGVLGSIMGVVAATTEQAVEPSLVSWTTGATLLVMVALGGRFTFFGPIVGVIILETARGFVQARSSHADLAVGLLVVLCAVIFPEGIGPRLQALAIDRRRAREIREVGEES